MVNIEQARKYCIGDISEIENWDKALDDQKVVWCVHHRLGETVSRDELIEKGLYYHRPASELKFVTPLEHVLIHHPNAKYICRDENGELRVTNPSTPKRLHGRGCLYQKRGRGAWRVKWMKNGQLHDISTGSLDFEEADVLASEIIRASES